MPKISTPNIDQSIETINTVICRHIASLGTNTRGMVSQDILAQLRNFLELIMLKYFACKGAVADAVTYQNIQEAIDYVSGRGNLRTLKRFHDFLQIVVSHYTLEEENSERLMLKYYEYLLKVKDMLHRDFQMDILQNIDQFPLDLDETLQEYYEKIAERVDVHDLPMTSRVERFYIQKTKPFFVRGKIYYEVTFVEATDSNAKSNRIIAFTDMDINSNYAVRLTVESDTIQIMDRVMPILIITYWEVSIRNCEYKNFTEIIRGKGKETREAEKRGLSQYMTETGFNLLDIVSFSDQRYERVKAQILQSVRHAVFFEDLDTCREIIKKSLPGSNLLRYLLLHMNNKIIKLQRGDSENTRLSNLFVPNGCIPFDRMPFTFSPKGHNPRFGDLLYAIPVQGREQELLAKHIRNNSEIKGELFTPVRDIVGFTEDVAVLARKYNDGLWYGHRDASKLVIEQGQMFINGYRDDTGCIVKRILDFSDDGIQNYTSTMNGWLDSGISGVDSEEKKETLQHMFENTRVALIYGSAGTGKSTLINHVAHFFSAKEKLFLAQTNPAVDNLKRKVTASNCEFMTIAKFIRNSYVQTEYDMVFVDECSTVSNRDMRALLDKAFPGDVSNKLLVLVGDIYQIRSIRFGNWFNVIKEFAPSGCIHELTKPYRSTDENLLKLWDYVRKMDDRILEQITRQNYSATLDASIFSPAEEDEIILCLNYDGLYGVNNVNRFLQSSNPHPPIYWGVQCFKEGDPVLFNESERFGTAIYNNMKGKIRRIKVVSRRTVEERIFFDVELEKQLNGSDIWGADLELLDDTEDGRSVVRFYVNRVRSTDDDDESGKNVIPFQVAYAVSIHKAQGLEYDSVKVIVSNEVDELITHNIFYTAITRARQRLKIYWTPEVEHNVLNRIKPININREVHLLRPYINEIS